MKTVSRNDWDAVVDEDQADAAFEAYKWALRDGHDTDTAYQAAADAAHRIIDLYRRASKKHTPEDKRAIWMKYQEHMNRDVLARSLLLP